MDGEAIPRTQRDGPVLMPVMTAIAHVGFSRIGR
jgi:hypothetical protein